MTGPDSLATSALEIPREWFRSESRALATVYSMGISHTGIRFSDDRAASLRLRQLDGQVSSGTNL